MLSLPWLVQNPTPQLSSILSYEKGEISVTVTGKIYQAAQCGTPILRLTPVFPKQMIA